jgi:hypothetical protein
MRRAWFCTTSSSQLLWCSTNTQTRLLLIALDGNVSRIHVPGKSKIHKKAHQKLADYIVYDVWIFVELLVVYFLFTETANLSLEQTAALLDGIDIKDAIVIGAKANTAVTTIVDVNREKQFDD